MNSLEKINVKRVTDQLRKHLSSICHTNVMVGSVNDNHIKREMDRVLQMYAKRMEMKSTIQSKQEHDRSLMDKKDQIIDILEKENSSGSDSLEYIVTLQPSQCAEQIILNFQVTK